MMIGFMIALPLILILGVSVILLLWKAQAFKPAKARTGEKMSGAFGGTVGGIAAAALIALILLPASVHTVQAGQVAVVKYLGEARTVRTAGTYFDFWMVNDYIEYDATVQTLDIQTSAYSKDAQTMDIKLTVQYKINPEQTLDIATKYGSLATLSNRIESVSVERTKSILSSYSAMEIIETRASISPKVEELIQQTISDNYYVTIVASVLTNIDFSSAFEETVENKMIAEQEVLTAEYEKEKAIIAAQQQLEVAKLQAQAVVAAAEADAQSQLLAAQAQADALAAKSVEVARMLGFTIDETRTEEGVTYTIDFTGKTAEEIKVISDYMKYIEYLQTWNGELPQTVITDSEGISVLIPTN